MKYGRAFVLLYCAATCFITSLHSSEVCEALVPSSLRAAVHKQYAEYRLPRMSDNLPEDVAYAREHGSHGCLGVTEGDFDGNGKKDFGLILTSQAKKEVVVVVALSQGSAWRLETVEREDGGPTRLYVERAEPKVYVETQAGDSAAASDPRARERFDSRHDGLFFGATESAERAYFRSAQGWVYVQVSD